MKPKDLFGVGVRLFGVWWLLQAIGSFYAFVEVEVGWVSAQPISIGSYAVAYAVHGAISLVGGVYLIMGAPLLMSLSGLAEREGRCAACGYDLTGNTSGVCPECGKEV